MIYPIHEEIPYDDPIAIFKLFAENQGAIFLDSAVTQEAYGRYSFIAVDPFHLLVTKNASSDPFLQLRTLLQQFPLSFHENLPPFQGGVAGYFSYDLCHHLEILPRVSDDMQFPDLILGFYDLVLAFDHVKKRAWIFSSGYPLQNAPERTMRAMERIAWLKNELQKNITTSVTKDAADFFVESNFTKTQYEAAVNNVIEYIRAGDIFEANISQRFRASLPEKFSAFTLYQKFRVINPAPFAAFLNFGKTKIISATPERFLKLINRNIETRPIKGTRPRGKNPTEDEIFAKALLQSAKDHAENVMIVDLLRNDLSKVCEAHSVIVKKLCGLESFATVHHLVSVIQAKLRAECDAIDLLRATFPGGSITGAPKIRAMEIIAEVEKIARGPYCGAIGYIGFNGDLDTAITIRTFAIQDNQMTFQAGGAVTLDSDASEEYEETLTKCAALKRVLA